VESIPVVKTSETNDDLVSRSNVLLLLSSLILGVLFDILFYNKPFGISYPVFVAVFYTVVLWNLRGNALYRVDFGWLMTIPIFALSLNYFFFSNVIFNLLNFVGIPLLITAQILLVTGRSRNRWFNAGFIADILYGVFVRPFVGFLKPFSLVSGLIRKRTKTNKYNTVLKVFVGLVISVPLLLIVILLLSSADMVFNNFMGMIPEFFENIKMNEILVQVFLITIITAGSFSFVLSLSGPKDAELLNAGQNGTKSVKGFWDPVTVITVFIAINAVYVFFAAIQFSYLFGSVGHVLPDQLTYSEYARRGFFELLAVTLINFSILLSCISFTKKGGKTEDRIIRILYSLLVVCTLVMLFSAYFRMSLYEKAYGYTYLRMLTHSFMVFLFVLFLIAMYKIWNDKISLIKPYIITALIAYTIVNYMNIDVVIARNNIDRYFETGKVDVYYLTNLSYDAVPELVRLIDSKDSEVSQHMENYLYEKKDELSRSQPWQSFNISRYRALKVLSKYQLHYKPIDYGTISR
jgi:hypothetical protein